MKVYGVKWSIPIKTHPQGLEEGVGGKFFTTEKAQDEFYDRLVAALELLAVPPYPYVCRWIQEVEE